MRQAVLVLAAFLGGCGGPRLTSSTGDVHAVPPELFFQTFTDDTGKSCGRIQTFQLVNSGRSSTDVTLTVKGDGVFQLRRTREHLKGGSNPIDVQCSAGNTGHFDATLSFKVDVTGQTGSIQLHCDIGTPPPCFSDDPCAPAKLDESCNCVHSVTAEDGACTTNDVCVINEKCVHGQCVGQNKDCNDQNICTRDACIPGAGCVHPDVSDDCPVPENPCMAGICDPHDGCKEVPADGKSCGERSCRLAQICDGGECKDRTPRNGDPCVGDCGDGTCQAQLCVERNGSQLGAEPVLEVNEPDVDVPGLVDSSGNVILIGHRPISLLAYGQAGGAGNVPIWNTSLKGGDASASVLRWNGKLVASTGLALTWVVPETGKIQQVLWLPSIENDNRAKAIPGSGIAVRAGDSVVTAFNVDDPSAMTCPGGTTENHVHLLGFSELYAKTLTAVVGGDLRRDPQNAGGMVADEKGNIFFTVGGCGQPDRLVGLTPDGAWLFPEHPLSCSGCEVEAAYHGTAYLAGELLVHYDDTGVTGEFVLPPGGVSPLLADSLVLAFDGGDPPLLRLIDSTGNRQPVDVALPDASSTGPAFLTKAGTIMVLETRYFQQSPSAWIAELAPDGRQIRACRLGDGEAVGPPSAGASGTLLQATSYGAPDQTPTLRIQRYHLPKFDFAQGGWRGEAGGPDRAWAP